MIAQQHPFIGKLTAANTRFHNRVRLHAGVHVDFYVNFHRAGESIRDRQSALPILWRLGPVHILEKRLGIPPRKRQRGNLRKRARFFRRDVFCTGDGSPTRGRGIAGHDVIVSDGAALDMAFRAPRAVGKNLAARGTVFGGIRIDEQGRRALALGGERFESAIAVRI